MISKRKLLKKIVSSVAVTSSMFACSLHCDARIIEKQVGTVHGSFDKDSKVLTITGKDAIPKNFLVDFFEEYILVNGPNAERNEIEFQKYYQTIPMCEPSVGFFRDCGVSESEAIEHEKKLKEELRQEKIRKLRESCKPSFILEKISQDVFMEIRKLIIGNGIKVIRSGAFSLLHIKEVYVSKGVEAEYGAFDEDTNVVRT